MIKYIDDFRQASAAIAAAKTIADTIGKIACGKEIRIMEICGGHTNAIHRFGIRQMLPLSVSLLSGPGCPVCVTPNSFIDTAIELSRKPGVVIATFGDMIRVPGSYSSLLSERQKNADIRICLSPMDALAIASENPSKKIVFLGIGFETTAPTIGVAIQTAFSRRLSNFSVLCALKTMPNALEALLSKGDVKIDGFICPGHVTAITGCRMYEPLASQYHIPCVISGFEPTDILKTIELIIRQINQGKSFVENQYSRTVRYEGNIKAQEIIADVFTPCDSSWRGIGMIQKSGLSIGSKYKDFDAARCFSVRLPEEKESPGCICGDIMRGVKIPPECGLFAKKACTPSDPKGACMVSAEGTCAVYFKYGK